MLYLSAVSLILSCTLVIAQNPSNWTWFEMTGRYGLSGTIPAARFAGLSLFTGSAAAGTKKYFMYGGWPGGQCGQFSDGYQLSIGHGDLYDAFYTQPWAWSPRSTGNAPADPCNAAMTSWTWTDPLTSKTWLLIYGGGGWSCPYCTTGFHIMDLDTFTWSEGTIKKAAGYAIDEIPSPMKNVGSIGFHKKYSAADGWGLFAMDMTKMPSDKTVTIAGISMNVTEQDKALMDTSGLEAAFFSTEEAMYLVRPGANYIWKSIFPANVDFNTSYTSWNGTEWTRSIFVGPPLPNTFAVKGVSGHTFLMGPIAGGELYSLDFEALTCERIVTFGPTTALGYTGLITAYDEELEMFILHGGYPGSYGGIKNTIYALAKSDGTWKQPLKRLTSKAPVQRSTIQEDYVEVATNAVVVGSTTRRIYNIKPKTAANIGASTSGTGLLNSTAIAGLILFAVICVVIAVVTTFYFRRRSAMAANGTNNTSIYDESVFTQNQSAYPGAPGAMNYANKPLDTEKPKGKPNFWEPFSVYSTATTESKSYIKPGPATTGPNTGPPVRSAGPKTSQSVASAFSSNSAGSGNRANNTMDSVYSVNSPTAYGGGTAYGNSGFTAYPTAVAYGMPMAFQGAPKIEASALRLETPSVAKRTFTIQPVTVLDSGTSKLLQTGTVLTGKLYTQDNHAQFIHEITLMTVLRMQNESIASILAYTENPNVIVYELAISGTFDTLWRDLSQYPSSTWNAQFVGPLIRDFTNALAFMNYRGIANNNLKSENVILKPHPREPRLMAVLTDFNIATQVNKFAVGAFFGIVEDSSYPFLSPEMAQFVANKKPTQLDPRFPFARDAYAYGITVYELTFRSVAWPGVSNEDILKNVIEGKKPNMESELSDQSLAKFIPIINECIGKEPVKRPQIAQLLPRLA